MFVLTSASRLTYILGSLLLLLLLLHLCPSPEFAESSLSPFRSSRRCPPNVDYLRGLKLSATINYAHAEIHAHSNVEAEQSESVDVDFPPFHKVYLGEDETQLPPCSIPIKLDLDFQPPPAKPDLSHITFGVATNIDRLEASLQDFAYWLAGTNAHLIALLELTRDDEMRRVEHKAATMAINLTIHDSSLTFTERYFSLTKHLLTHSPPTPWSILIDDDTFFPAPAALAAYLATFSPSLPHYIGALTEDFNQLRNFGVHAYGGAGVILSRPLLAALAPHHASCLAHRAEGDVMLANCIYAHTATKLTLTHRLHQLDMNGDLAGFYEAGAAREAPLSLHHWKSWHAANMTELAAVAAVCGEGCLLRRWRFGDGWWVTNGFSVVRYGVERPLGDVAMEKTWVEDGDYRHSFDPLREKDEGKVSLRLEAVEVERRKVRQYYVRRAAPGGVDDVVELVWMKK